MLGEPRRSLAAVDYIVGIWQKGCREGDTLAVYIHLIMEHAGSSPEPPNGANLKSCKHLGYASGIKERHQQPIQAANVAIFPYKVT